MCANCLTTFEFVAGKVALAAWVAAEPAQRALANLGVVEARDLVARDAHTVAFLRSLELEPAELLGAEVVARADAHPQRVRASRRRFSPSPIGSHSLPIAQ
jgi:hypothetical protein